MSDTNKLTPHFYTTQSPIHIQMEALRTMNTKPIFIGAVPDPALVQVLRKGSWPQHIHVRLPRISGAYGIYYDLGFNHAENKELGKLQEYLLVPNQKILKDFRNIPPAILISKDGIAYEA